MAVSYQRYQWQHRDTAMQSLYCSFDTRQHHWVKTKAAAAVAMPPIASSHTAQTQRPHGFKSYLVKSQTVWEENSMDKVCQTKFSMP